MKITVVNQKKLLNTVNVKLEWLSRDNLSSPLVALVTCTVDM